MSDLTLPREQKRTLSRASGGEEQLYYKAVVSRLGVQVPCCPQYLERLVLAGGYRIVKAESTAWDTVVSCAACNSTLVVLDAETVQDTEAGVRDGRYAQRTAAAGDWSNEYQSFCIDRTSARFEAPVGEMMVGIAPE